MRLPVFKEIVSILLPHRPLLFPCLPFLVAVFAVYFLVGREELLGVSSPLEVGVAAVSAALAGLILNAGVNLMGKKREETIRVAQKFITVVVLIIIFPPFLYFAELLGGINTNVFEPGSPEA